MINKPDPVAVLLKHNAKIDVRNQLGATPLILAAWWGDPETVSLLIDAGADVNVIDNSGQTALDFAIKRARGPSMVERLKKAGAKTATELVSGK